MSLFKIFDPILIEARQSKLRLPILRTLLRGDNLLRRWITFFALESGKHPKHRLTRYHDFFLEHISPESRVLDIGSGLGYLAHDISKKARQVTGIDINPKYLSFARRKFNHTNLVFIQGDATTYQFPEKFDVAILSNVLEHIQDRIPFLKKVAALAPKILIRVPMMDRDWIVLLKKEQNIDYRLDPTHETEFTEAAFRQEIQAAGLKISLLSIRFGELYSVVQA